MCCIHRRCREMQTGDGEGEGGERLGGNGLQEPDSCGNRTHTLLPLIYCTYTPTEAGLFLRGRCSSCTVAHVLCLHLHCGWKDGWMVGWMEDRAKSFHLSASIVRSSRKDFLPDTIGDRAGGEIKKDNSQFLKMRAVLKSQRSKSDQK